MESYDLVVIGGGPIGSTLAKEVAKAGKKVLIVERKKNIGYPNHCSGMVSREFVKEFPLKENLILNRIKGSKVFSLNNKSTQFKREQEFAIVINRIAFDKELFEEATSLGVNYLLGTSLSSYKREKGKVLLFLNGNEKKEIMAKTVAIATGASSSIKKMFGFNNEGRRIITFQTEELFTVEDQEMVYIYMNNEITRNWFAWVIPLGNGYCRIGLGTEDNGNIIEKFNLLKEKWIMMQGKEISLSSPVVWSIPIGLSRNTVIDNCIIVGDAALQTKPFSGGGLYTGMLSAKIAAQTLIKAFDIDDFSRQSLYSYERNWRKAVGREIKIEQTLRDIYETLSDNDKSEIIKNFDEKKLGVIVDKYGMIDEPWKAGFRIALQGKDIIIKYLKQKINKIFTTSK